MPATAPPPPTPPAQAVTRGEGEALARDYGMAFFETSAKKDIGVSEAFMSIARQVVGRLGDNAGGPGGHKAGAGKAAPKGGDDKAVDISAKPKKEGGCCSK